MDCFVKKMGVCTLFQRVQVENLIQKMNKLGCLVRSLSDMEKILQNYVGNTSKLMSKLYQLMLGNRGGVDRAKLDWEKKISWKKWRRMDLTGKNY